MPIKIINNIRLYNVHKKLYCLFINFYNYLHQYDQLHQCYTLLS